MKQSGKITPLNGSLKPTQRVLWYSAQEKLVEANIGINEMRIANHRIAYESGWIRFIDSLEEFWTSFFDEGKKTYSNFQPWIGKYDKERRKDPLLSYLIQSRHKSQHEEVKLEWSNSSIQIAPNYFGHIKNLIILEDGSFEVEANPLGNTKNNVTLEQDYGKPILPTIENRGVHFTPPIMHLDSVVSDNSPLAISLIGYSYYNTKLNEAIKKFVSLKT